jgi:cell division cycle 20-like protein 1 (cofactor of APC complex)
MNVLDWSINDNISVGLGNCLYLWNYQSGDLKKLKTYSNQGIPTSLTFDLHSEILVVGTKTGQVEVRDIATNLVIRQINAHN